MQTTSMLRLSPRPQGASNGLRAVALSLALLVFLPIPASADDGFATWYGPGFQGDAMANGQIYNMYDPTTTASNSFPFGTWVQVTNPANGRTVVVQVRDRGGFHYAFDLSYAAFKLIANPAVMGISIRYQVVAGPSGAAITRRATQTPTGQTLAATTYVVQPGDNLDAIAAQLGLDSASLAAWNGISDPNLLKAGQTLRLATPLSAVAPAGHGYVVQAGDSLLEIAGRFGIPADQLASANGIADPGEIQIGQSLAIPSAHSKVTTRTYTVHPGDTISGIAQGFGVTQDSILASNHMGDPNSISEGQALTIPGA